MHLLGWFLVCLVAAVGLRHRPLLMVLTGVTLWFVVPGLAANVLVGGASSVRAPHPAAVFVLAGTAVQVAIRPRWVTLSMRRRPEWAVLLAAVCAAALLSGVGQPIGHLDLVGALVNQLLAPLAVFFVLGSHLLTHPTSSRTVMIWLVGVCVAEAAFSLIQLTFSSTLVYRGHFANQPILVEGSNRWMGTLDHPLVLSFLLVVGMAFVACFERWWLILAVDIVLLAGLVAAQSRVGVGIGLLTFVFAAFRAPVARGSHRVLLLAAFAVVTAAALARGVTSALQARVADDTGSAGARFDALGWFVTHISRFLWSGGGLNSSFTVAGGAGLQTSFESGIVMYIIDIGLLAALLYFGVMVAVTVRSWRTWGVSGPTLAALAVLVIPQTFSALSGSTAGPVLVWLTLSIAASGRDPAMHPFAKAPVETSTRDLSRR